ncbi:recombinase family protein [Salinarimonas soli]|uniref:Recombinase family protein n=1 Tax=Salinarimonas soli TaxID=1638099 RepID=A0A5B2VC42_9HYPH|nr:recombinase family protein [Salinarimonas soli]KAA2235982.1 recombinase family protein [Salinarimonas soli]
MKAHAPPQLRCAIYTRVSTDHGLEQEFNSLDNQREAAEAYVKSQSHEGWRCLPERYDDGGFSGGTIDRPAMQRLLADIRARRIDVVVVYKVDRLTRSLADFAKLVELFDAHGVSFVSVTQAFNTTNSMGRLTLNVLLSFAQFEREVTGERIRDKIAASKKKGIWMGGHIPLGYRVEARKLLIERSEAATVRLIFERYLALGSLPALQRELRERGVLTRPRSRASGATVGGVPFTNGPLAHVLRNRVYVGEINHKSHSHKGEHEAIVSQALFEAVQERLGDNLNGKRGRALASEAILIGRVFDDRGNRMTPTHANKGGVRYRYYASCVLAQGRKEDAGSVARVSAPDIEALVLTALRQRPGALALSDRELIDTHVERVIIGEGAIEIDLADGSDQLRLSWTRPAPVRKRQIITFNTGEGRPRPIRAEARERLVGAIATARAWLAEIIDGSAESTAIIAEREQLSERSVRMTLGLAFLAPDIVRAAVEGRLPRGAGLSSMVEMPTLWSEQERMMAEH